MGTTVHEREARELLEKYATPIRQTTHGTLYKFENAATSRRETVLVGGHGSSDHGQGSDERKWRAALRDVRRAVKTVFGVAYQEKEDVEPNPIKPLAVSRPSPLAGLQVQTHEKKIVVSEITKTVELAPHHVHALLRGCGYDVPDSAKVTFTAQGYVRVSWTKTVESEEG